MADIALTALRVLVGKNYLTVGAVVNESGVAVCKTVLEKLKEYVLSPSVILFVGCIDGSRPVKGEANALKLTCKLFDIGIGKYSGVC